MEESETGVCAHFEHWPVNAFYAIMRAGAAVVPVNPMLRAAELPHYVLDPGARVAICTADVAPSYSGRNSGSMMPANCAAHW